MKLSMPPVSMIEPDRITGEKSSHDMGEGRGTGTEQQVCMVGDQGPGIAGGWGFAKNFPETRNKIIPVQVVPENDLTLDPPDDDVMEGSGRINSGLSWHKKTIKPYLPQCQLLNWYVPKIALNPASTASFFVLAPIASTASSNSRSSNAKLVLFIRLSPPISFCLIDGIFRQHSGILSRCLYILRLPIPSLNL
jgi:hypothetical protein